MGATAAAAAGEARIQKARATPSVLAWGATEPLRLSVLGGIERPVARQEPLDLRPEPLHRDRLGQEGAGAGEQALGAVARVAVLRGGGQKENGRVLEGGHALDAPAQIEAVHVGKLDVEDDDGRRAALQ